MHHNQPEMSYLEVSSPPPTSSSDIDPNASPTRILRGPGIPKPYRCSFAFCKRRYLTAISLQKHQKYHPKNFLCRYVPCTDVFVSARDRTRHEVSAHGKSEHYSCYLCAYSTDNRNYIRSHVSRMHEGVSIEAALSKIIDNTSPEELELECGSQGNILQPIEDKSTSRCLACDICNCYSTGKRVNLYQHIWRKHHGVATKEAMARIVGAVEPGEVEKE